MREGPSRVRDVMTKTVVAVGQDAPFKEIVRALEQWRVSAVPVVDDDRRVVGVVSEADLLPKEEFRDQRLTIGAPRERPLATARVGALRARELMSAPAVTVPRNAALPRAARLMAHHGYRRLPVTDESGRLTGIVSRADLLTVFLRPDKDIEDEVRRTVVGVLFPGLSRSVSVRVRDGVVTLSGRVPDARLVSVAARLAQSVEGVVAVESHLEGPPAAATEQAPDQLRAH